jgi:hypothetical protein
VPHLKGRRTRDRSKPARKRGPTPDCHTSPFCPRRRAVAAHGTVTVRVAGVHCTPSMQTSCQTPSFCGFRRNTVVESAQIWHEFGDLAFRPQGTSHVWASRVWATLHGTLMQIANVPLPTAWSANRCPGTMFVHHRPNLHPSGLSNTVRNGCGYAFGSVPICELRSSSSK